MPIDETVVEYHDIVPRPRELGWAEQNIPTFLGFARRYSLCQQPVDPVVEQKPYSPRIVINMPSIPSSYDLPPDKNNPAIHAFGLLETALDRMTFPQGEVQLKLRMNEDSWENFCSGLPGSEDFMLGAMNATSAIFDYATRRLREKGFHVLSVGIGFINDNTVDLKLRYN